MDNSKYEAVLKAVQTACPDLEQYETVPCPDGMVGCCVHHQRKIYTPARLSHVLRAIREVEDRKGYFIRVETSGGIRWIKSFENDIYAECYYDLTKDDLSLQSPDTIDFLFKILCE